MQIFRVNLLRKLNAGGHQIHSLDLLGVGWGGRMMVGGRAQGCLNFYCYHMGKMLVISLRGLI